MNSSKRIFFVVFMLLVAFAIPAFAQAQPNMIIGKYPKGRLFLYDGRIVEGKKLLMSGETISLTVYGAIQTFQLDEIQQIMVKKGHASLLACGCGIGCLGIAGLAYAVTGGEIENEDGTIEKMKFGEYALGSLIWAGLCAGGGYLIGYIFDGWSIAYYLPRSFEMRPHTSLPSRHDKTNKGIPLLILKCSF